MQWVRILTIYAYKYQQYLRGERRVYLLAEIGSTFLAWKSSDQNSSPWVFIIQGGLGLEYIDRSDFFECSHAS